MLSGYAQNLEHQDRAKICHCHAEGTAWVSLGKGFSLVGVKRFTKLWMPHPLIFQGSSILKKEYVAWMYEQMGMLSNLSRKHQIELNSG